MLTTSSGVRVLGPPDLREFLALIEQDPVVNVFSDYRARTTQLDRRWLGGEVFGRYVDGRLVSALHVGANLVPIEFGPEDPAAYAERLAGRPQYFSTLVGPHEAVEALWGAIESTVTGPREFRWRQPHMVITGPPAVAPDPEVRRTDSKDLDALYPSCVAMYTEEVGVSPETGGGAGMYRARITQLISRGWSFARFDEDGRVVFKAEVACASPYAAQIQGVYTVPDRRGEGLATAGMAAVVALVQAEIAPTVSLYVNEWNLAARRCYEKAGFITDRLFSTVMF